jgi:hypothetical protein
METQKIGPSHTGCPFFLVYLFVASMYFGENNRTGEIDAWLGLVLSE